LSLYVDASALLKLYLEESDSDACRAILRADRRWHSANHSQVEVRRNLRRGLRGRALVEARKLFAIDWAGLNAVELDSRTCAEAAAVAEDSGVRTLDALHLAAARRVLERDMRFLTYDRRQAETARSLGFDVVAV